MAETNKTEKATPKKKKDERKKGNAFQSKDVASVAVIIIGFTLVRTLGSYIVAHIEEFYQSQMFKITMLNDLTIENCLQLSREAMMMFFICAMPIIVGISIVGIVMAGIQTRFLVSMDLLKFKYSRISMIQGFKRILSIRSLVQLLKSLIKVGVILWIIYSSVSDLMILTPDMLNTSIDVNIGFMLERIASLVYKICLIFVAVAVLDFAYEKYDFEKKLMMTKQEIKDEYKQTEGDPFIKGKIKEKQRKISMNRMIQQVPLADVIIRNPTHFAVALKYDIENDAAPIVLAKGQDFMAKRIIDKAIKSKVLIIENKPLARSLYETVEVNSYIPADLYQAVAEVMAWVYSNKDKVEK